MTATARLNKELRDAHKSKEEDIRLGLFNEKDDSSSSILSWRAVLAGPKDSPFEGGKYEVMIKVPTDYPISPPKASFITKVFHPNVEFKTGEICLDILKTKWTPAWTLMAVCRAIASLLDDPEGSSPLNCDAGNLTREDMVGYNSLAKYYAVVDGKAPATQW
jgi:peroxin-4